MSSIERQVITGIIAIDGQPAVEFESGKAIPVLEAGVEDQIVYFVTPREDGGRNLMMYPISPDFHFGGEIKLIDSEVRATLNTREREAIDWLNRTHPVSVPPRISPPQPKE